MRVKVASLLRSDDGDELIDDGGGIFVRKTSASTCNVRASTQDQLKSDKKGERPHREFVLALGD